MEDFEFGLEDNAMAIKRPVGEHVSVVRFERPGDGEALDLVAHLQGPLELRCAGIAQIQARMIRAAQVFRALRGSMGFQIGRGGTEQASAIGDLADAQV